MDESPLTLLVIDGPHTRADIDTVVGRCRFAVDVLAWGASATAETRAVERLGTQLGHQLPGAELMRRALPIARERLVRFSAAWPQQANAFGTSFRRAFATHGCSLWWFTELSQKNPGTRSTLARLCQLEALRSVLAAGSYAEVVLASRDRDHARVLADACRQSNVRVVAPLRGAAAGHGFVRLLMGRFKRAAIDMAATWLARRRRLPAAPMDLGRPRRVAFHTWYPTQWRPWRGVPRDRYYVDVVDRARSSTPWQIYYVCAIPAPTFHAVRANLARAVEAVRTNPGDYVFLESASSVTAVFRIYADLRVAFRYWWLERMDRRFRRSFDWDGIDIFPLARHDVRSTMVRDAPFFELLASRVRAFVAAARPTDLVTTLETYSYGRAVAWGAGRAPVPPRVVGYQHSPINANQLMYRFSPEETAETDVAGWIDRVPLPDHFLLQGEFARGLLRASGVADARMTVCGAPRFDRLLEFRQLRRDRFTDLRREWTTDPAVLLIVVSLVIWPELTSALIEICGRALADRPDTVVIFKPHPMHAHVAGEVAAAAGGHARFIVSDADLTQLQASADLMVGTLSTSDVEAVAIGCPVIQVRLADIDLSPTADLPGVATEVTTAAELRDAVERIRSSGTRVDRDPSPSFIASVFCRLDGRAADRVVDALAAIG